MVCLELCTYSVHSLHIKCQYVHFGTCHVLNGTCYVAFTRCYVHFMKTYHVISSTYYATIHTYQAPPRSFSPPSLLVARHKAVHRSREASPKEAQRRMMHAHLTYDRAPGRRRLVLWRREKCRTRAKRTDVRAVSRGSSFAKNPRTCSDVVRLLVSAPIFDREGPARTMRDQ